ncbi:MAG: hypothetical protein L0I44_10530, partial [Enterococcus sp.]|nr:hypothetical protein [Enterococcus sp.]
DGSFFFFGYRSNRIKKMTVFIKNGKLNMKKTLKEYMKLKKNKKNLTHTTIALVRIIFRSTAY